MTGDAAVVPGGGGTAPAPADKRRALAFLALAEFLGMSVWFSASAVVPALAAAWGLGPSGMAWLTMSVQLGFVAGAFGSAVLNLADLLPSRGFFSISALLAAGATALIPAAASVPAAAFALRFLTGVFLAGVYPVGMKIMATWTRRDRGWGIGLLVGALTLGSAAPPSHPGPGRDRGLAARPPRERRPRRGRRPRRPPLCPRGARPRARAAF